MTGHKTGFALKRNTWAMIGLIILVFALLAFQYGGDTTKVEESSPMMMEGQEYTVSEMLDTQKDETVYLLGENGAPIMWNVYLHQARGSSIITGVTYRPEQLVFIASYGSDGETLQEKQLIRKAEYPDIPADIAYSMFGKIEKLETIGYAMELSLPEGTETIRMYSNRNG